MDALDFQLLYMIAKSAGTGEPVSTWNLASQQTESSAKRNRLDSIYRYRLNVLAKLGILKEVPYTKGKQTFKSYILNPNKIVCAQGSLLILSNPVTILACPNVEKCASQCNITLEEKGGKVVIKGCELLSHAPEDIRALVYKHMQGSP